MGPRSANRVSPVRPALLLTAWALVAGLPGSGQAQDSLPLVAEADWSWLRAHGGDLLQGLSRVGASLPADTEQAVRALLHEPSTDPDKAARRLQQLLDIHCLIGVTINPQSRVKAARGPAVAALRQGQVSFWLVKVHNDAGVTGPLGVRCQPERGSGDWLEARLEAPKPLSNSLSGRRVEYVLLRLTAHEAGKREATLEFDVGQGTQDLGFRAEVPVLFTIRAAVRQ